MFAIISNKLYNIKEERRDMMEQIKDKAILVGLELKSSKFSMEESLQELKYLASALNIDTMDMVIQKAERVNARSYVGRGKVLEIKNLVDIHEATMVIFDDPLSPAQIKNLEIELDTQVIDRSFLILSIFAERAQTRKSILEVSLAQKSYMLPRLVGLGKSLSRQGGGTYNAKGPGETKLEMDRRKLLKEISQIKQELALISKEYETSRKKRLTSQIAVVALVGYTNVGKSSLMNSLTNILSSDKKEVFEKDMLFATLDTKVKRLQKDNYPPFLLIDTVGFIRKLPRELVNSFESTLMDVIGADLLVMVADGANFEDYQLTETTSILERINANDIPKLFCFTMKDKTDEYPIIKEDYHFVSNVTKEGLDDLINSIYGHIYGDSKMVTLNINFNESNIFDYIKNKSTIINIEYLDTGYLIKTILTKRDQERFNKYIVN